MKMTGPKRYERRLVALLAADVAGFSRHVEADEVETMRALEAQREVMDRVTADHAAGSPIRRTVVSWPSS